MTENEAIDILGNCRKCISLIGNECYGDKKCFKSKRMAISAIKEIQQYRALGTIEDIKKIIAFLSFDGETGLIDDVNLLNQYRMLGTAEEFREAMERQREKKPFAPLTLGSEGTCPICSVAQFSKRKYCYNCEQAIDWSEAEE